MKQPTLSRRQARWMEFLQEFGNDLTIHYLKGKSNVVADALSRRPDYTLNAITAIVPDPKWLSQLKEGYLQDPDTKKMLDEDFASENIFIDDGLIYLIKDNKNRLCIPNVPALQTKITAAHHD